MAKKTFRGKVGGRKVVCTAKKGGKNKGFNCKPASAVTKGRKRRSSSRRRSRKSRR